MHAQVLAHYLPGDSLSCSHKGTNTTKLDKMKISILVSALAFTAVFAEAEISSLRASSSRSLTEDSHHALPLVQPPMYLDTYVPCQRHAHDGKCGFWSLTGMHGSSDVHPSHCPRATRPGSFGAPCMHCATPTSVPSLRFLTHGLRTPVQRISTSYAVTS